MTASAGRRLPVEPLKGSARGLIRVEYRHCRTTATRRQDEATAAVAKAKRLSQRCSDIPATRGPTGLAKDPEAFTRDAHQGFKRCAQLEAFIAKHTRLPRAAQSAMLLDVARSNREKYSLHGWYYGNPRRLKQGRQPEEATKRLKEVLGSWFDETPSS